MDGVSRLGPDLLACIPSGDLVTMAAREGIKELLFGPGWSQPSSSSPNFVLFHFMHASTREFDLIGFTAKDEYPRMTQWSNPFDPRLWGKVGSTGLSLPAAIEPSEAGRCSFPVPSQTPLCHRCASRGLLCFSCRVASSDLIVDLYGN